jgi:hypothetical protein
MLISVFGLGACTTIPKENFDDYRQSFAQVKISTEDMILEAHARAEAWVEHPGNTMPVVERTHKLLVWQTALKDRQAALDTVDRYNTVLVRLAAGEDPADIEGSLIGIAEGLDSFASSSFSSSIASSVPYFGVAAKLLAAIEEEANREEFKRLVAAAQMPIAEIIRILIADAPDLEIIFVTQLLLERSPLEAQADKIHFRFTGFANTFKPSPEEATSKPLEELFEKHNALRISLDIDPRPTASAHNPGTTGASASDLEVLALIIDEEREVIARVNALSARIEAQKNLTATYVASLNAMTGFFVAMNTDLKQGKRQAALEFARRGLEYRQAILELREGV